MTTDQLLTKWKETRTSPVAIQHYVLKDDAGLNTLQQFAVDYCDDEYSLKAMNNATASKGFQFFINTDEGQTWVKDNEQELKRSVIWAFAPIWGFTKEQAIKLLNDIE